MSYQKKVKEAFETIESSKIQVFTALVNVAMNSEFSDVDELFEEGELFSFKSSDFDHATDPNILSLLAVVKALEIAEEEMLTWNGSGLMDD
ncbi:hypothetical protein [Algoriphagus algorifonticola]|uniref:hypothetical protein n=1 Tax=Algoriphagus algorifonticola TaxID=2593007 RepID=UPI0011A64433|nr:hypothetical protein [Algoriphagus algorifonticola]